MSIFEKFAEAFPFVSDENERWSKEGPMLTDLARASGAGEGRVIDLACGSGFHARHLAGEGFKVMAVDSSAAAMDTGKTFPGGDKVNWVVGDITKPAKGQNDLVLLVGNTLSLFDEESDVEAIFASASSLLVPSGVFLVHIIDFEHLRQNAVHINRKGSLAGTPITFDKRIDPTEDGAVITIHLTTASGTEEDTEKLHEWKVFHLELVSVSFGLVLEETYGTMEMNTRIPGHTKDVVMLFRKSGDMT